MAPFDKIISAQFYGIRFFYHGTHYCATYRTRKPPLTKCTTHYVKHTAQYHLLLEEIIRGSIDFKDTCLVLHSSGVLDGVATKAMYFLSRLEHEGTGFFV